MATYHLTPEYILNKMSLPQVFLYFDWSLYRSGAKKEKPKIAGSSRNDKTCQEQADQIRKEIYG